MTTLPVLESLHAAAGRTPLVRLGRSVSTLDAQVFAKLEFLNPMGSVKDRIARFLVEEALASGELEPGGVIVEASSGNTALGLAMMAIHHDLRCCMVVRRETSKEKLDCLRALGVELVLVDGSLPPDHPDSYNRKARSLAEQIPGAWFPDQHNNRANNAAHYRSTGPEIWEQMEGRIDAFVAGIGTGGTISGVARYLKERDPDLRVVAVDVEGSVFTRWFSDREPCEPGPYRLEGLGDEEIIDCPEFELIDAMIQVSDREAFHFTRHLARTEGMLAGGSSGAALWGVHRAAADLAPGARIVTLFPDSGSRYLSTLFNDDWLALQGLEEPPASLPRSG